jgi:hypothetical protein
MTHGRFHRLDSNLDSVPKDPSMNPGSKCEEIGLFEGSLHAAVVRVDTGLRDVADPVGPGGKSSSIVHCHSANPYPHSVEIMLHQRPEGGWTPFQSRCCGR